VDKWLKWIKKAFELSKKADDLGKSSLYVQLWSSCEKGIGAKKI
jgi:hypothetical protein